MHKAFPLLSNMAVPNCMHFDHKGCQSHIFPQLYQYLPYERWPSFHCSASFPLSRVGSCVQNTCLPFSKLFPMWFLLTTAFPPKKKTNKKNSGRFLMPFDESTLLLCFPLQDTPSLMLQQQSQPLSSNRRWQWDKIWPRMQHMKPTLPSQLLHAVMATEHFSPVFVSLLKSDTGRKILSLVILTPSWF